MESHMAVDIDALKEIISGADRMLIVTHDHPDPDALTSAAVLAKLAESFSDVHYRIVCTGYVGRAENRALKRELHINLSAPHRFNWNKWAVIALVDAQPHTGNNCLPKGQSADIVIDHHPLHKKVRAKYVDVRPELGACATMMTEYLDAAGIEPDPDMAAGLCYAIASETQDLNREACSKDSETYARLYLKANKKVLARILHPQLRHSYYYTLTHALLAAFTYGNIIGSHLDEIDHPDSVSLVADLLLRRRRNTWCIVTGVWKNDLYISLRSEGKRGHAGRILRKMLSGLGSAGGHSQMAGGRVSLKGMDSAKRQKLQDEIVQRLIKQIRRRKKVPLKPLISPDELDRVFRRADRPEKPNGGAQK